jgi:hypothetical protein
VLGGKYDLTMETLSHYLDFVGMYVPYAQLAAMLPRFSEMASRFRLTPPQCFGVARPILRQIVATLAAKAAEKKKSSASASALPDAPVEDVVLEPAITLWDFRAVRCNKTLQPRPLLQSSSFVLSWRDP